MFIFSLALLVLLVSCLPWVAIFRPPNKPAGLMTFYLICSTNIILTFLVAGSFHLLSSQWFVLILYLFIGGVGWMIWGSVGKPPVWGPFQDWKPKLNVQKVKREPLLALLVLFIILSYSFALAQIIYIPQNNLDSLSTHLSRIGFWRQFGSLLPWSTTMLNQVWYPVNAQLQTFWTLLFFGGDQLVGSIQWLAALVSALGIFGIARFYGYHHRQSAFAALIFLTFPLIALQSTTTQTDLVTAVFFVLSVYFLFLGLRDGHYSLLSLSAIGVGLGVGVKKSFFLFLPILAVLALLAVMQFGRGRLKALLFWSLNCLLGILLLGSYTYVVNWRYYGDPFGTPAYLDYLIETSPDPGAFAKMMMPSRARFVPNDDPHLPNLTTDSPIEPGIFMELIYNTPRLLYQSLDSSGLPRPLDGYAHKVKMRVARSFFQLIGFEEIEGTAYTAPGHAFNFSDKNINEESHAWYGPLSFLLLFPALIIESRRGKKQRLPLFLGPGIALLLFLPMEIILRPGWDPYQGRYFAPLVALCSPFMALWFRKGRNGLSEWLISGLAVVVLVVTLLYNPSKPTVGKFAEEFHIWNNERIFIQTIQGKRDRELYYKVEMFVPADATMGYYIPFFILDYPLFGEKLTRRLVPMGLASQVSDIQWLRDQGVEYLLLPDRDGYPTPPFEYEVIAGWKGWILYAYTPSP